MRKWVEESTGIEYRSDYKRRAYTAADFYESYKADIEPMSDYDVGYKKYRQIIKDFFELLMDKIISGAVEYKLPAGLGWVFVCKMRPRVTKAGKHLNIDFSATNSIGKKIFHLNEHSDGWQYRFVWRKRKSRMKNIAYYEMVHSRWAKRELAKQIKENKRDYIVRR